MRLGRRRPTTSVRTRSETWTGYAFIAPALLFYVVFLALPTLGTVLISFLNWTGISLNNIGWAGLDNYAALARDPVARDALIHNIVFIALGTTATVVLGLFLAVLLEKGLRGSNFFRGIFFIPSVTSLVVVGLVFTLMLSPDLGIVNPLLRSAGLGNLARPWLGDPATSLPMVIVADIWRSFGLAMFIFVAGLKGIDADLYEAAETDGASGWQMFWGITLPLLKPVIATVVVLLTVGSLKLFDLVYVMTNGGPNHASEVLSTWTFYQAFTQNRIGYGASISVTLLILTLVVGVIQVRARRED